MFFKVTVLLHEAAHAASGTVWLVTR